MTGDNSIYVQVPKAGAPFDMASGEETEPVVDGEISDKVDSELDSANAVVIVNANEAHAYLDKFGTSTLTSEQMEIIQNDGIGTMSPPFTISREALYGTD